MKTIILTLLFCSLAFSQSNKNVFSVVDSLIRPADNTAYTAGDAINDTLTATKVLVFSIPGEFAGSGEITEVYAMTDTSNSQAIRVHLYTDSTSIERAADNAAIAFLGTVGRIGRKLGYAAVTISGYVTANSGYGQATGLGLPFKFTTTTNKIYGIVEDATAFTPKINGKYFFVLKGYRY